MNISDVGEKESFNKINYAYADGGGERAKQVAGRVIGMQIQYFISVSFSGLIKAIDDLGGVEVEVPIAFDDYYYPVYGLENETCGKTPEDVKEILETLSGFEIDKQFPCRFEHIHFEQGKQLMNGEATLKFVRSRHSAQHGGDFARSERQQALLLGIKDRLMSLGAFDNAVPFFNKLSYTLKTDIDKEVIEKLVSLISDPSEFKIVKVNLSTENVFDSSSGNEGQFILIPKEGMGKWEAVYGYIQEQLTKQ